MVSLLTTSDTCVSLTAVNGGWGLATTWVISGQSELYTDTLDTDGYQITAFFTWRDVFSVNQMSAAPAITAATTCVIGTCVETRDPNGDQLAAGKTTVGNYAICHWLYVQVQSGSATLNTSGTFGGGLAGTDWGETRYLTETEWGTAGAALTGATAHTTGTAVGAAHGFALSDTGLTAFVPKAVYSMSWFQPKWATTYAANKLRRYSANQNPADQVLAYCMGTRPVSSTVQAIDIARATHAGADGVVTLAGAASLLASVAALGTVALAM